jgi:hypothetical protein
MPHSQSPAPKRAREAAGRKLRPNRRGTIGPRYSVGLPPAVAHEVQRYADTVDTSMSKAIAALVRLGLDNQENRKREFFRKLKENLTNHDPKQQDRVVDEFRALILGR